VLPGTPEEAWLPVKLSDKNADLKKRIDYAAEIVMDYLPWGDRKIAPCLSWKLAEILLNTLDLSIPFQPIPLEEDMGDRRNTR
jgi:hypothetical protein